MLPSLVSVTRFSGQWQVLGREPEVDRVFRHVAERPLGREPRLARFLPAEHRRLGLADHLDVAQRELEVLAAREVEVVDAEGLLEDRGVLFLGEREYRLAVVEHEVAADLVGAVGEPVRVLVARGCEQQPGAVRGAARDDDELALERLLLAVVVDDDAGDCGSRLVGLQPDRLRARHQRHVGVLERRPDGDHLGVGFGVYQARESRRSCRNARTCCRACWTRRA